MKAKIVIGLAVLTAAAVAGAVLVTSPLDGERVADTGANRLLFPQLGERLNDVKTASVARAGGTATLERTETGWKLVEKGGYPADFDRVRKMLLELAQMRTVEAKTKLPESYAALEVEDMGAEAKSTLVTLKDGSGQELAKLHVGKQRYGKGSGTTGDGTYVRKAGDAQAWMVEGRFNLERDTIGWLGRSIVTIPRERVQSVATIQADGARLEVRRDKPSDKNFAIVDMPQGRKAKSEYDVNDVGNAFGGLDLEDVRPAAEVAFKPDGQRAEMTTFDGLTLRALVAEQDGQAWLRFEAGYAAPAAAQPEDEAKAGQLKPAEEAQKEVAAINERAGAWAYRLTTYKTDVMRKKKDDVTVEDKAS